VLCLSLFFDRALALLCKLFETTEEAARLYRRGCGKKSKNGSFILLLGTAYSGRIVACPKACLPNLNLLLGSDGTGYMIFMVLVGGLDDFEGA